MTDYISFVRSVESASFHSPNQRLLHAAMGICTEAGELFELTSDLHMIEELGDLCWYLALGYDAIDLAWDFELEGDIQFRGDTPVDSLAIYSSELLDVLKKQIFYGREFNVGRVADLLFTMKQVVIGRLAMVGDEITFDMVIEANIKKLMKRYPDKFSEAAANERDVKAEYAAMTA